MPLGQCYGPAMLGKYVSKNRRRKWVGTIAGKCRRFLDRYENANDYAFESNGEQFVLQTLARHHNFTCIFDVGANVGDWAKLAHQACPRAKIHCFEIMPPTAEILRRNTAGVPNIIVNECGLAETEGEIRLNYYPDVNTLTTMTDYPHEFVREEAVGLTISGDSYVERQGIDRIHFLKLDVEGAENLVLRGLQRTIEQGRVDIIQFEYGQVSILTKFLLRDFYTFFTDRGYRVGKIYPNHVEFREYVFEHEDFRGSNYLAIRSDRPELLQGLT